MKKNVALVFLSYLLFCGFIQAQTYKIQAFIKNTRNENIENANVTLSNVNESMQVKFTVSDKSGHFMIQEVSKGEYTLKVSYLGYVTYKQSVKVDQNIDLGVLSLDDSITSLKQVIITPKMIETFADKKIYRLTTDQKKVYSSSLGALEVIPKLQVSNNQVSMLNSKAVKILINDIASDASDLSVIPPSDILRIEFYETPPARFANLGLGGVVNVIVKRDKGGSLAMNLQKGITSKWTIGTGNFKYNWGNSQIGIKYNMNYHNDNKRLLDETLYYSVNGITYNKNKIGKNSPYIFTDQLAEINFTNQKVDNYIFNAKLSLNSFDRKRSSNQIVFSKTGSEDTLKEAGMSTDKDSYLKPIADLYFSKQINKNKEFVINVVGTYYKTKYDYNYSEVYNDAENFYTSTWITGNKNSLIGDALYGYTFGKNKLTIGARYTNASATQDTMRNQSISQTSWNNELYEYAELSSSLGKKFTYALSAGLNYNSFNCDITDKKYSYFYFRPSLTATYNFNDRNDLQFSYQVNTITPTLSELSNTPYFKDEKYVFSGNNNLNPFNQHELSLSYDYENKRLTYSVELSLQYAKNPIAPVFIQDSDYILQTEANIDNLETYSASMFFQWYLFENNMVRLRCYSELFRTDNKYNNLNWGHTDYRVIPSILVDYKKWDLEIFYQSSTKVMTGQLLTEKPSMAKVELSYKPVKNLTATLAIRYPFYDAWKTSTQTCDSCILKHLETERVKNDANMVYFNVVYYFSFGKLKKDIRKKLNNSDNDSGILNRS